MTLLSSRQTVIGPVLVLVLGPYLPVRPSQTLMDLSKEAEATRRVSGEKSTSLTRALWPVILARGFLSSAGFHRNMVKSSEPDTRRSGVEP